MAQKRDVQGFVLPLAEKLAEEMGYELIDAELVKEGPGRYLRIYLNKEGGITLDDCERFHRAVQPKLESVEYDFLEISSPGLDRPLKTTKDFQRALGTEVEVRLYRPLDGQKAFTGTLVSGDETEVALDTATGSRAFPRKDVALVKPVLIFEDEDEEEE